MIKIKPTVKPIRLNMCKVKMYTAVFHHNTVHMTSVQRYSSQDLVTCSLQTKMALYIKGNKEQGLLLFEQIVPGRSTLLMLLKST